MTKVFRLITLLCFLSFITFISCKKEDAEDSKNDVDDADLVQNTNDSTSVEDTITYLAGWTTNRINEVKLNCQETYPDFPEDCDCVIEGLAQSYTPEQIDTVFDNPGLKEYNELTDIFTECSADGLFNNMMEQGEEIPVDDEVLPGWTEEIITETKQDCITSENYTADECNCLVDNLSTSVPYNDFTEGENLENTALVNQIFAECGIELFPEEENNYAEGWTTATVEELKESCITSEEGTREECNCYVETIARNINTADLGTNDAAAAMQESIYNSCFGIIN